MRIEAATKYSCHHGEERTFDAVRPFPAFVIMMHPGHAVGSGFIDLGLLNQRKRCEMLHSEKQQSRCGSGQKDYRNQFTKAVHNSLVTGKAIGVASIMGRIMRPRDRREPDEIEKNHSKDRAANAGHRAVRLHSRVTGAEIVVEVDMDLGLKFSMLLHPGPGSGILESLRCPQGPNREVR